MSDPFLTEIRIVSFNFPPKGWAFCNGQLLPINQNQAVFSLLGTTYGGDGRVNFALPDLRGRAAMSMGSGHTLGERGGEVAHTVTTPELPTHIHSFQGSSNPGGSTIPAGNLFATAANTYTAAASLTTLIPATVTQVGGNQPHENRQPFLTLSFCIALQGIFPSQN